MPGNHLEILLPDRWLTQNPEHRWTIADQRRKERLDDVRDVPDFNATVAWCLGIDPGHEEMSASGGPFKLADRGKARKELFA